MMSLTSRLMFVDQGGSITSAWRGMGFAITHTNSTYAAIREVGRSADGIGQPGLPPPRRPSATPSSRDGQARSYAADCRRTFEVVVTGIAHRAAHWISRQ